VTATRLCLVRHGETAWNAERRIQGRLDVPLASAGHAQARALHTAEAAAHPGEQVLVFTHGGVLDILHRRASGKPLCAPRDFDIPNAALNWLEAGPERWSILGWAERSHLDEALDELPG